MPSNYKRFVESHAPELRFEHRIVKADGALAYGKGIGEWHSVEAGEIVIGFVQDITQFKKAEDKVPQAAQQLKPAGYMACLGSWRVDLDPGRVTWNPEAASIHDDSAPRRGVGSG